ncbi:MAG: flagellar basal body-associated FliL family protein [Defluviitaleaceae bacterium]|nr:flagellar basal body-associated FliL family protein [Defluviitaleaceae bacterium]
MRSKEKRTGLIVAFVLLLILLVAIAFAITQNIFSSSPANFVRVPVVQTHVLSQDGNTHMFGAQVVIELDPDAPSIDGSALYAEVLAAISSLSYEDISGFYGMDILRDAVRARVSHNLGNDIELLGVYFSQFLSDMPLPNLEEDRVPGRNPFADIFLNN